MGRGALTSGLTTIPRFVDAAAERFGDAPFLTSATERRTFAETAGHVARGATWLHERGVTRGDRVLISGGNAVGTIEAWLAAVHAGAIPAAVNPALTEPELQYVVDDLQPRVALLGDAQIGAMHSEARDASPAPLPGGEPADAAAIVYTSGTTSRPKGALVRHLAYVGAGQSMRSWLGLRDAERLWCVLPFFHINAQAYSLMTALANGYPLAVSPKFRASTFWRDAAELSVTEVNLIGAMVAILARQPAAAFVRGALRTIYAAPALEPPENRALETRFGVRIVTGFGMSECTFGCIETPTSRAKSASIGRPRTHPAGSIPNELRIVAPSGELAPRGTVGELQFRNAAVTPGYWNAPEITERTLQDGWLRTGDAGYVDGDGDVVLAGRYKEMIRRRGENIAPREVEDALALHPGVQQAAVVGVASSLSEEDVVACVVRAPGAAVEEAELREFCAARLAPYKIPARIVFLDAFPLTPTMRVAKERLKAEIAPLLAEAPR
ncbi:MAG: AMP-binding protein [Candidatus Eremiobacteraeota bacterium]|nr:AMP-binding protein [Candidatus Eremiobacteraeota bacterium]